MCQSIHGGQVYPQETCGPQEGQRTLGHTIQWSQAISKKTYDKQVLILTKNFPRNIVFEETISPGVIVICQNAFEIEPFQWPL